MELKVKSNLLYQAKKQTKKPSEELEERHSWVREESNQVYSLNAEKLFPKELELLKKLAEKNPTKFNNTLKNRINKFNSLRTNADLSAIPKLLNQIPVLLKKIMEEESPNRWLFFTKGDGGLYPLYVESIEFHKTRQEMGYTIPAHVDINTAYEKENKKETQRFTFHKQHLKIPIGKLLEMKGLFLETPEAVENYYETMERYEDLIQKTGLQMIATGKARTVESRRWWNSTYEAMVKDGAPTKCVIDHSVNDDYDSAKTTGIAIEDDFWDTAIFVKEDDWDDEESDREIYLPVHPYLQIFDLMKHRKLVINIEFLSEYKWNKTLFDKLVLQQEHKDLISILMESTGESMDDIAKGKMNGVIVLATGKPGIGKTLTAEVFSENIEKPLYTVQCSQLGLNVEKVEDNLKTIMGRAERWGAILLIDEADVYIRERGDNIEQNAIVGVFLRVLEYYKGILFMTSNRGDIIDDAIMSRSTAWIQYELPQPNELTQIWKVLGNQYGAKFTKKELDQLTDHFKGISGRTVRNLLKLAHLLSKKHKDKKITVDMIKTISNYQKLEN